MGDRSLYDTDIVAWADQQAIALRSLNARDLPNELDLLWKRALRQADLDLAERGRPDARERIRQSLDHDKCPISLDELCMEDAEFSHLVMRVAESASARPRR